jgi:hypothetical protein
MDTISAARELLPAWVPWGNVLLYLPAAFLISFVSVWIGAALALRSLRKADPATWVERARLSYPARRGVVRAALVLAVSFGLLALAHNGPVNRLRGGPFLVLAGLVSYAGSLLVIYGAMRRVRPVPWPSGDWLRGQLVLLLVFYPHVLVLLTLFALMPDTFNAWAVALLVLGGFALVLGGRGGGLLLAAASAWCGGPPPGWRRPSRGRRRGPASGRRRCASCAPPSPTRSSSRCRAGWPSPTACWGRWTTARWPRSAPTSWPT